MYFMGPAGGVKIDIDMININVLYGQTSSCVKIESGEILLDRIAHPFSDLYGMKVKV